MKQFAHLAMLSLVMGGLASSPTPVCAQTVSSSQVYDIAPSSLASALEDFADQSGSQIVFESRLVAGRRSAGARGAMSDTEALARIIGDAPIAVERIAHDIVVLRQAPQHTRAATPTRPQTWAPDRDEVIITARRRAELRQSHPGSVFAFDEAELQSRRVDGVEDVVARVPNAFFEERPGGDMNVFMRGAGTATNGSGTRTDAAIGLYYDGAYSYLQGSRIPLFFYDMERVEALQGPQGALYGRNAVGGAIIAQTARPRPDFGARLRLESGDYDSRLFEGVLNLPLDENTWLRLSGLASERDSFYRNALSGRTEHGDQTTAWRMRMRLAPSNNVELLIGYEQMVEDKGPQILVPARFGEGHVSVSDTNSGTDRETERWNIAARWRGWRGVELRSVTGHLRVHSEQSSDFNNLSFRASTNEFFVGQQRFTLNGLQFSQDLVIASVGPDPLQWLAGVSYFQDRKKNSSDILSGFPSDMLVRSMRNGQSGINMLTAFGEVSYDFGRGLNVTGSLRYSYEERTGRASDAAIVSSVTGLVVPTPFFEFAVDYDNLSPGLSLRYDLTADISAYAKVSTGYQSGGINPRASTMARSAFGPSTAVSYEAGLRSAWLDGALLANVTTFRMLQEDYQYQLANPPFDEFTNAGEAQTDGVEAELIVRPNRWVHVLLSLGYLDARVTHAPNAIGGAIEGRRLQGMPRMTGATAVDLRAPVERIGGEAFLNLNYTLLRDRYLSGASRSLDDVDVADIRVGLDWPGGLSIYAYGENVFDDVHVITQALAGSSILSPPRRVGLGIVWRR